MPCCLPFAPDVPVEAPENLDYTLGRVAIPEWRNLGRRSSRGQDVIDRFDGRLGPGSDETVRSLGDGYRSFR